MSAATTSTLTSNGISQRQGSTRRLIKVDYSVIQNLYGEDDENDLDKDESDSSAVDKTPNDKEPTKWPNQNGASNQSNGNSYNSSNVLFRTAYDLATQCPSRRSSLRRHTIIGSTNTAYMPRPHSPTSCWTDGTAADKESNGNGISPEISWSRNSLQDDLFDSKQWQDECLSLTLEEIVHIRSVLTKAELESLPVEGHVKQDVERRKVCFLCLKTRFGLFGPWGNICRLCRRTVCSKCHCKMRIPTEHFAHVPVIALSPTLLSPTDTEQSSSLSSTPTHSTSSRLYVPNNTEHRTSTGSVPNSPRFQRNTTLPADSNMNSCNFHADLSLGPQSLPMTLNIASPQHTSSPIKRNPLDRCKTLTRSSSKAEKLKGLEMTVCTDCKAMVIQIIKASRNNRNDLIDKLIMSNRLVT